MPVGSFACRGQSRNAICFMIAYPRQDAGHQNGMARRQQRERLGVGPCFLPWDALGSLRKRQRPLLGPTRAPSPSERRLPRDVKRKEDLYPKAKKRAAFPSPYTVPMQAGSQARLCANAIHRKPCKFFRRTLP